MKIATPTSSVKITLESRYFGATAIVIGQRWPNGDIWLTSRQVKNASKRAGLAEGDHWLKISGGGREGYLYQP